MKTFRLDACVVDLFYKLYCLVNDSDWTLAFVTGLSSQLINVRTGSMSWSYITCLQIHL
jgi:hypothetical protein